MFVPFERSGEAANGRGTAEDSIATLLLMALGPTGRRGSLLHDGSKAARQKIKVPLTTTIRPEVASTDIGIIAARRTPASGGGRSNVP
jgi:hypothetical protein